MKKRPIVPSEYQISFYQFFAVKTCTTMAVISHCESLYLPLNTAGLR